jgi:hypothetical protein
MGVGWSGDITLNPKEGWKGDKGTEPMLGGKRIKMSFSSSMPY